MVGGGNIEGIERQSELDGVVEVYPFMRDSLGAQIEERIVSTPCVPVVE